VPTPPPALASLPIDVRGKVSAAVAVSPPASLLIRLASAVVLLAITIGAVLGGVVSFALLLSAFAIAAAAEFFSVTVALGRAAPRWVLYPLTLVLLLRFQLPREAVTAGLTLAIVLGLSGFLWQRQPAEAMTRWALALGGSLWIGWCLGFYLAIFVVRQPDPNHIGFAALVALAGSAMVGDTTALVVGGRLGRRPFFPAISPKKTIEGAIAGFIAQTLFVAVFGLLADIPLIPGLFLGALVAIASQAGDLIESQLKRSAGLKDASALIPGHGGFLDRLDSLILPPATAYYFFTLVLHLKLPQ